MKNLKLCLLAAAAIFTSASTLCGSETSDAGGLSDHSCTSSTVTETDVDAAIPVAEQIEFHYRAQISTAKKREKANKQAFLTIEGIEEETRALFSREEANLLEALEELREAYRDGMSTIEQNIADTKHAHELLLDVQAYSGYIVTVLAGVEAFTNDPKTELDEITLFVAMKQLSESNMETLNRVQNTCENMEGLVVDAKVTMDEVNACGLYAHVNEEIAKINVMSIANEIATTRKLLDTFNTDIVKQVLATDAMKCLMASIWEKAHPYTCAKTIRNEIKLIKRGLFNPFSLYPAIPIELSSTAIQNLLAYHPEARGITAEISKVTAAISTPTLTPDAEQHLNNLQQTITKAMSALDAARPETKIFKLIAELDGVVRYITKPLGPIENSHYDKLKSLLTTIESREEFSILGMFVLDEPAARTTLTQAHALVA